MSRQSSVSGQCAAAEDGRSLKLAPSEDVPRLILLPTVPELSRYLALSDACVVPASWTTLSEASGLGIPTLGLAASGDPHQQSAAAYYRNRHGVTTLDPESPTPEKVAGALRELLAPNAPRPHAPDEKHQRRNAEIVADLIAEHLGRRRPGS